MIVKGRGTKFERCGLALGTSDTVALRVGCLDDELQVGDIGGDTVQGEGYRGRCEDDSRPGGCLDTGIPRIAHIFSEDGFLPAEYSTEDLFTEKRLLLPNNLTRFGRKFGKNFGID